MSAERPGRRDSPVRLGPPPSPQLEQRLDEERDRAARSARRRRVASIVVGGVLLLGVPLAVAWWEELLVGFFASQAEQGDWQAYEELTSRGERARAREIVGVRLRETRAVRLAASGPDDAIELVIETKRGLSALEGARAVLSIEREGRPALVARSTTVLPGPGGRARVPLSSFKVGEIDSGHAVSLFGRDGGVDVRTHGLEPGVVTARLGLELRASSLFEGVGGHVWPIGVPPSETFELDVAAGRSFRARRWLYTFRGTATTAESLVVGGVEVGLAIDATAPFAASWVVTNRSGLPMDVLITPISLGVGAAPLAPAAVRIDGMAAGAVERVPISGAGSNDVTEVFADADIDVRVSGTVEDGASAGD